MLRRKAPSSDNEANYSYNFISKKKDIRGGAHNRFGMIYTLLICVGGVAGCFSVFFIILHFCLPAQFDPTRLIATERIMLHHPSPATLHDSNEINLVQSQVQIGSRFIPHQQGKLFINTIHAVHRTKRPNNGKVIVLLHGVRLIMYITLYALI